MEIHDKEKNFLVNIALFCVGIIFGTLFGLFWDNTFSPELVNQMVENKRNEQLKMLDSETRERLLKYVEGRWRSSIGDVIINIQDSNVNGNFIVIENTNVVPPKQETFKVTKIDKIDGIFGILKLEICSSNTSCNKKDQIPIQINKVFGLNKTITMSYDTRFTHCIPIDKLCTRALKEIHEN